MLVSGDVLGRSRGVLLLGGGGRVGGPGCLAVVKGRVCQSAVGGWRGSGPHIRFETEDRLLLCAAGFSDHVDIWPDGWFHPAYSEHVACRAQGILLDRLDAAGRQSREVRDRSEAGEDS
jgi:hypothetical protein